MAQVTIRRQAEGGERFEDGAFDDGIGKPFTASKPDGTAVTGELLAARVVDDGQAVDLTLEVPDDPAPAKPTGNPYSSERPPA